VETVLTYAYLVALITGVSVAVWLWSVLLGKPRRTIEERRFLGFSLSAAGFFLTALIPFLGVGPVSPSE
jgi:MFS-type transporter involved in bile tolerance (Atg22 family)